MATFYKYAERSAESQINWAEIGKNMTDMLQQEVAIREQKKAAIDEATRKYAEQLSNAPQGEHVGAKQEALRFADEATNYMLMQERLLKSGLMKPRDYLIARQNLIDGTTRAFSAMKAFQEQYAERMERARTDTSSALELDDLEEVQGYGNFSQSGFFIDAPTGKVNVGLKEIQTIDGKQVVGLKEGSTRGMEYIDGSIYGKIDKFKPREALVGIAETLGTDIISSVDPATLTKLGTITSIEDLRNRKDIDPDTKEVLFEFYSSIKSSVNSVMANPLQKASLLRDTLGYRTTLDANEAAKDPKLILKVIDPATGRGEYQFSAAQDAEAEKWMTGQLLGMINRKITIEGTGFVPQPRAQTEAEISRDERRRDAANFGKNLGIAVKSDNDEEVANAIRYLAQKSGRQVERKGGKIMVYDLDGKGKSEFDLKGDPDKLTSSLISAFGVDLPEDIILQFSKSTLEGRPVNASSEAIGITSAPTATPLKVVLPTSPFEEDSIDAETSLQALMPEGFIVTNLSIKAGSGDNLEVKAPNGKKFPIKSDLSKYEAEKMRDVLVAWMKANNVAPPQNEQTQGTQGNQGEGTTVSGGNVR